MRWWDVLLRDLRYAVRGLRARPGFAAAVVLTLALGIGANAAIFSVVDRLLFRPPPMLSDPALTHRIYVSSTYRGEEFINGGIPYARYVDFTNWTKGFARTAEVTSRELAVGVGTAAREMQVGAVSASFFGFFDAPPALGRYFSAQEDTPPDGTPVVVLSYAMWQTRYGGRSDVLGSTLQIGPTVYTVIGVAPKGFVGLWPEKAPVAYIPISSYAAGVEIRLKGEHWWDTYHWTWANMIAQRKPGVSIAAANADLTSALKRSYSAADEKYGESRANSEERARDHAIIASILSERGPRQSSTAKVAALVGAMALVVLLIACANVANLLFARALRRRREIALRVALGVSRGRLLSQLLTESLLLALIGGVAGLILAQWGGSALRAAFLPAGAESPVMNDTRTLIYVGVAVMIAGILTGLAPAFQAGKTDLTVDLKAGEREGVIHKSRTRVALLLLQGALSVVLLVGAGLFVRSLSNVKNIRLGYDPDSVLVVDLAMRGVELDSVQALTLRRQLLERAQAIPGVEHAALNVTLPFWSTWSMGLNIPGVDSARMDGQFDLNAVSPDYFATMGTRIVRGRGIEAGDVTGAPGAVVVSASMAKKLWPGEDALGKCIKIGSTTDPCNYVVGIAEDIKNEKLSDDPGLYYYLSAEQYHPERTGLLLRMHGDATSQVESVRRELQKLMPGASYITVTPFSDVVGQQMKSWSLGATMFVVFGILALVLATIGLYGVIAYNVVQRSHEMGVRIALGAQQGDVVWLVVRQGLVIAAVGILIGG
ncbi:MAG TPA: ADOP family duplicated permease, partial [Gemmatimonadaceae bacterium]|nr:ADOP family duplicated permease [Gemmatimonadaceae bacterium]